MDAEVVMQMFAADTKLNISPQYLKPGFAFGGSCLPKDVRALNYRAKELDLKLPLLESEGRQILIWDENVSLGRLIGSNQQYIEEVIPHIGSLMCSRLEQVVRGAELVIVGTRAVDRETLRRNLRPDQAVIDLVNLEKDRRLQVRTAYEGICW